MNRITAIPLLLVLSLVPSYAGKIDFINSTFLHQREYTNAACEETNPLVSTGQLNGCIFLVVHDTVQNKGFAAHFDDETRLNMLEELLQNLVNQGSDIRNLQAYLVGGWKKNSSFYHSQWNGDALVSKLEAFGLANINKENLFKKKTPLSNHSLVRSLISGNYSLHYFSGASFDFCSGDLILSSNQNAPESFSPEPGDLDCSTPTTIYQPQTGCDLNFATTKPLAHKTNDEL